MPPLPAIAPSTRFGHVNPCITCQMPVVKRQPNGIELAGMVHKKLKETTHWHLAWADLDPQTTNWNHPKKNEQYLILKGRLKVQATESLPPKLLSESWTSPKISCSRVTLLSSRVLPLIVRFGLGKTARQISRCAHAGARDPHLRKLHGGELVFVFPEENRHDGFLLLPPDLLFKNGEIKSVFFLQLSYCAAPRAGAWEALRHLATPPVG